MIHTFLFLKISWLNSPLMILFWLSWIPSLSSVCLCTSSVRICSMIISGRRVKLTSQEFPGPCFLPFKRWVQFPLLQSPGTSPGCHAYHGAYLVNNMNQFPQVSGIHFILPIDWQTFMFLRWSRIWSLLTMGRI